eukprot:GHVP01015088.1.p2 GENE.GHVP01015088.1~~GHVP01015088.1.p2  ORF type:complete len:576 (-),score=131.07 GHVP01015088.1:5798-7525(-)
MKICHLALLQAFFLKETQCRTTGKINIAETPEYLEKVKSENSFQCNEIGRQAYEEYRDQCSGQLTPASSLLSPATEERNNILTDSQKIPTAMAGIEEVRNEGKRFATFQNKKDFDPKPKRNIGDLLDASLEQIGRENVKKIGSKNVQGKLEKLQVPLLDIGNGNAVGSSALEGLGELSNGKLKNQGLLSDSFRNREFELSGLQDNIGSQVNKILSDFDIDELNLNGKLQEKLKSLDLDEISFPKLGSGSNLAGSQIPENLKLGKTGKRKPESGDMKFKQKLVGQKKNLLNGNSKLFSELKFGDTEIGNLEFQNMKLGELPIGNGKLQGKLGQLNLEEISLPNVEGGLGKGILSDLDLGTFNFGELTTGGGSIGALDLASGKLLNGSLFKGKLGSLRVRQPVRNEVNPQATPVTSRASLRSPVTSQASLRTPVTSRASLRSPVTSQASFGAASNPINYGSPSSPAPSNQLAARMISPGSAASAAQPVPAFVAATSSKNTFSTSNLPIMNTPRTVSPDMDSMLDHLRIRQLTEVSFDSACLSQCTTTFRNLCTSQNSCNQQDCSNSAFDSCVKILMA